MKIVNIKTYESNLTEKIGFNSNKLLK